MSSKLWQGFAKRQQAIERKYTPQMAKAIAIDVAKVKHHIKTNGTANYQSYVQHTVKGIDVLNVLRKVHFTSAITEATYTYKELRRTVKKRGMGISEAWQSIVRGRINDINNFKTVEQINDTTKKRLLQIIGDGIANGDSYEEIVNSISIEGISLQRAQLIVRTESVGAMNYGSMMGAISTGIVYKKQWITASDHRVRGLQPKDIFSHVTLQGQIQNMDKPFNNGEDIHYPGDKSASPGNFCNCRCTQKYIPQRNEDGSLQLIGQMEQAIQSGNTSQFSMVLSMIMQSLFGGILSGLLASDE